MIFRSTHIALLVMGLLGVAAVADEPGTAENVVEVTGSRSIVSVPYKQAYEIAKKVQTASEGRLALAMRLEPKKAGVRMDGLRLTLSTDNDDRLLPLQEGIFFVIPVLDKAVEENGVFFLNRKKGDVGGSILLVPTADQQHWTMGRVRQTIADGDRAVKTFVPWYWRIFSGTVEAVGICTPQAGATIAVQAGEQLVASVKTEHREINPLGKPVYCASFNGKEVYADDVQLVLPAEGEAQLL